MGNLFKREYHSSVLDNPSMTELILPPDSFQLGGPDTPQDRCSPGLPSGCRVAADKSVLQKLFQVRACPSSGEALCPCSQGSRHAGPPGPESRDKTTPLPSSQGWGQTLELLSAGTGRHHGT